MRYVLDTNAVSALMKGDEVVARRMAQIGRADVAIPQPVLAEIEFGIRRLPASKRRDALTERLELIRSELGRSPWTDDVSARFGDVRSALERRGERIDDFDAAIAAHALAESAILVTADAVHMARVEGLTVEDWSQRDPESRQ